MRTVVGVTDNRWAAFLRDRGDLTEANFWQPSPHGFKALSPGEPFLFKTKDPKKFRNVDIPGYALVGGGFFDEAESIMCASLGDQEAPELADDLSRRHRS